MRDHNSHIVYGLHPILEIIKAKKRKIYEIFTTKNSSKEISNIIKTVPGYTIINYCDKKKLDELANTSDHQSIVALVSQFIYVKNLFDPIKYPVILLCDSIQDTKNLGALLRSAYCTNISGVILTEVASAQISGSVLKSSAGLAEYIAIYQAKNSKSALDEVKKNGYTIYLAAANGKAINETILEKPCCLVIGNEHSGINKNLYSYGEIISLKQKETCISYNASVAGGILLYHVANQFNLI